MKRAVGRGGDVSDPLVQEVLRSRSFSNTLEEFTRPLR